MSMTALARAVETMTAREIAALLGITKPMVNYHIKTGKLRVVTPGHGALPALINAEDVRRLAEALTDRTKRGVKKGLSAATCVHEAEESRCAVLTDEVKQAGQRLIKALAQACRDAGLSKDEAEGGIAYLLGGLGDDIETRIRMLHRDRGSVRNHTQEHSAMEARA